MESIYKACKRVWNIAQIAWAHTVLLFPSAFIEEELNDMVLCIEDQSDVGDLTHIDFEYNLELFEVKLQKLREGYDVAAILVYFKHDEMTRPRQFFGIWKDFLAECLLHKECRGGFRVQDPVRQQPSNLDAFFRLSSFVRSQL